MSVQYRYDDLSRLIAAVHDDGQEISYAYDAAGNLVSVMVKGGSASALKEKPPVVEVLQEHDSTVPEIAAPEPGDTFTEIELPSAMITVMNGPLENQHFPLSEALQIGRGADNGLALPDKKASRHHAVIQRQGEIYQITDLGSSNGTRVNGNRITEPTQIKSEDIIIIGDTKFKVSDQL